ncbi:MAG: cobalamin-dependent protein [Archangium sp.]
MPLSPALLIGAGTGEATCGILYIASYLRRHGIEAYVRLSDGDETEAEMKRSLSDLISRVRPKVIGISLKWFHHVARALQLARLIRKIDRKVRIAVGGNSASYFWKELMAFDCIDHVVLGDGEVPFLSLCRGDEAPINVATPTNLKAPLDYIQSSKSEDVYYSHFDQLFLSEFDRSSFSGWVAPGKGCGENCLYCGGTRGMQKATFGRAKPFLRPEESVAKDHREIANHTWQLRYDFQGSSAEFLEKCWGGVDLSKHSTTYFLWGVPPRDLIDKLSERFARVFMVLDIGCFAESQRVKLMKLGLLKPCPTDAELMKVIAHARSHANLELEISGIASLPFATPATLDEERRLIEKLLSMNCTIGYQRLESQPGALVTEHPARFHMISEATSFAEFLNYFENVDASMRTVPMVRYADENFEAEVEETFAELDDAVLNHAAQRAQIPVTPKTRLKNAAPAMRKLTLGEWFGPHAVPAALHDEAVTAVRSSNGTGLVCAPSVSPRKFAHPSLHQGKEAQAISVCAGSVLVERAGSGRRRHQEARPRQARAHRSPRASALPPAVSLVFGPQQQAAWKQWTARTEPNPSRSFEELYPSSDDVLKWIDAMLIDNALQCEGHQPRTELRFAHAEHLFNQTRRGFGWGNYRQPDGFMQKEWVRDLTALCAALAGAWDLVAQVLGGRPLARKVLINKTYDGWKDFGGLVRHVATAARHRLGEGSCAVALQAWSKNPRCEPKVLMALARLAINGAGGHPVGEVSTRFEALLRGEGANAVHKAESKVEDPRASVFEKYQPILTNSRRALDNGGHFTPVGGFALTWLGGYDFDVAKYAAKLESGGYPWPSAGSIVAAAVGHPHKSWRGELEKSLKRVSTPRQVKSASRYRRSTIIAAIALAFGDTKLVKKFTAGPQKEVFKGGKTFGDDARKVLRYFALAIDAKAKPKDVEPAWLELLVSRVPDDYDDTATGGAWSWPGLFCLAYAYFHLLGKTPEGKVGEALRKTLRGQDPNDP